MPLEWQQHIDRDGTGCGVVAIGDYVFKAGRAREARIGRERDRPIRIERGQAADGLQPYAGELPGVNLAGINR